MRRYLRLVLKIHLPILETGLGLDNGIDWGCRAQKRRREYYLESLDQNFP